MRKTTVGCREINKQGTRCFVSKKGKWCWNNSTRKNNCGKSRGLRRLRRRSVGVCRLVKGDKETCCINPKRGHWCWSNNTKKRTIKKMKRSCCNI